MKHHKVKSTINENRNPLELNFDDMCWPNPSDPQDLEWILRHGSHDKPLSKMDRLICASFMGAYKQMIRMSQKDRNKLVSNIRRETI